MAQFCQKVTQQWIFSQLELGLTIWVKWVSQFHRKNLTWIMVSYSVSWIVSNLSWHKFPASSKKEKKIYKKILSNCYDSILLSCDKVKQKWCQSDAKVTAKWCKSDKGSVYQMASWIFWHYESMKLIKWIDDKIPSNCHVIISLSCNKVTPKWQRICSLNGFYE